MKILIVLLGALGDVARGMSLLPPLKKAYPEARIAWLVETKSAGLVRCNPLVDEVIEFRRADPIKGVLDTVARLRRSRFDLVLDLQRHAKSGLFSLATLAPRRIGVNRKNAKEFNWLCNTEQTAFVADTSSKMYLYEAFLTALGVSAPLDPSGGLDRVAFLSELPQEVRELKERGAIVGLVLGSTWPTKDWPRTGYAGLVQRILDAHHCSIVLLGDKTQKALGDTLASKYVDSRVLSLAGKTSLGGLLAVLGQCDCVIGPDSGPGHLCSLLDVPYIGLFGPTNPARVAPFRSRHLVIQEDIGCSPCWRRTCPGLDTLCMRSIMPSTVFDKLCSIIPPELGNVRRTT
jgi:heptosyltransferase-1